MSQIIPVILSGGAGSRLWPLSTQHMPKQFHALHGPNTMFSDTLARVRTGQELEFGPALVVCGLAHRQPVLAELESAGVEGATIILEPMPRNTAPALAVAALVQSERDPNALMLVVPADHVITKPENLHQACIDARQVALDGKIVTFAIKPLHPETGYGYIKSGQALVDGVFAVEAFREKPDRATAEHYLQDGSYSWNAGIFYFRVQAFLAELERHAPLVLSQARDALLAAQRSDGQIELDAEAFSKAPSISIDYAVMEPTEHAAVVPVDMGWSDVGSFATLWELAEKDRDGNGAVGSVAFFDAQNCFVRGSEIPIALIGVSDLLVISTAQGILITPRDRAQDVRLAAEAFKASK